LWILVTAAACGSSTPTPQPPTGPVTPDASHEIVEPAEVIDTWSGTLVLGIEMRDIVVRFDGHPGHWAATMEVPELKLANIQLTDLVYEADRIEFTFAKPDRKHNEHYTLARTGDSASGQGAVGSQHFPAKLVKLKPGEAPHSAIARPQTPQPPYPYTEREASIPAPEKGVLAGTLTIPQGTGPFPAVLLISGSGQQDRDETIFRHKPFLVIADRLTREGFAVLRTDDRATGKTQGAVGSLETEIGDQRAAFEWLLKQPEVDPKRAGIIGHSAGGLYAPTIAARTGKVAFVIALAGPGVSGAELVPLQLEAMMIAQKMSETAAKRIADAQRKVGAAIVKGDTKVIRAELKASFVEAAGALGQPTPDDATLEKLVDKKLLEVSNPWVVGFFKADPAIVWKKTRCPVLAVIGDKDLQVPADANLPKIEAAVKAGGNKDVTVMKLPGLNHMYQHAGTGLIDEYATIEETFDPATLDTIVNWMKDKTKKK
jgi:hypothetical protein